MIIPGSYGFLTFFFSSLKKRNHCGHSLFLLSMCPHLMISFFFIRRREKEKVILEPRSRFSFLFFFFIVLFQENNKKKEIENGLSFSWRSGCWRWPHGQSLRTVPPSTISFIMMKEKREFKEAIDWKLSADKSCGPIVDRFQSLLSLFFLSSKGNESWRSGERKCCYLCKERERQENY